MEKTEKVLAIDAVCNLGATAKIAEPNIAKDDKDKRIAEKNTEVAKKENRRNNEVRSKRKLKVIETYS